MDHEATMWRQWSKVQWLKDCDKKTPFFHSKSLQQRRRNYIKGLYDDGREWCTQPSCVTDIVVQFYHNLFTSSNLDSFDEITKRIPHMVTSNMNQQLTYEFSVLRS